VRKLQWAGVLLGTLLLLFLAFLGAVDRLENAAELPKPSLPQGSRFRIGVLGDAQKGLANFRNITLATLQQGVGLIIQTGDLVSSNDEGHYRLARRYRVRGGASEIPFVVAPGNHDLKGDPSRFDRWLGPIESSTVDGDVAVVTLNNAFGAPPDLKHVEARIAAAGPHKTVILAMHVPPFDVQGTPRPEFAGFLAWLEKSKVAYLLCGHVHTYMKKKVGETTVIINGVGGDYDSWQLGQKVYATILDVDGSRITDRTIEIEPVHEIWENVEHLAIGHVAEAYRQHPWVCWGATLLLFGGVGWGWSKLLRRREPFRQAVG
jgi:predicted phosphodiesterase